MVVHSVQDGSQTWQAPKVSKKRVLGVQMQVFPLISKLVAAQASQSPETSSQPEQLLWQVWQLSEPSVNCSVGMQ